jgi:Mrp family chromosome partitioning ATPase
LSDEPGFIESLRQRSVDSRSVFATETPGLSFMPAGQRNGGVELELTANGAFKAFVAEGRSKYDIVILDSPPILPVADASILSRQVDGTVLVVRQETSNRVAVVDALASIGSAGGKLLGTVFLASQQKALYGYGSPYAYGDVN